MIFITLTANWNGMYVEYFFVFMLPSMFPQLVTLWKRVHYDSNLIITLIIVIAFSFIEIVCLIFIKLMK